MKKVKLYNKASNEVKDTIQAQVGFSEGDFGAFEDNTAQGINPSKIGRTKETDTKYLLKKSAFDGKLPLVKKALQDNNFSNEDIDTFTRLITSYVKNDDFEYSWPDEEQKIFSRCKETIRSTLGTSFYSDLITSKLSITHINNEIYAGTITHKLFPSNTPVGSIVTFQNEGNIGFASKMIDHVATLEEWNTHNNQQKVSQLAKGIFESILFGNFDMHSGNVLISSNTNDTTNNLEYNAFMIDFGGAQMVHFTSEKTFMDKYIKFYNNYGIVDDSDIKDIYSTINNIVAQDITQLDNFIDGQFYKIYKSGVDMSNIGEKLYLEQGKNKTTTFDVTQATFDDNTKKLVINKDIERRTDGGGSLKTPDDLPLYQQIANGYKALLHNQINIAKEHGLRLEKEHNYLFTEQKQLSYVERLSKENNNNRHIIRK